MIHNTTERQTNFQPNPRFRYHLGNSGQKRIGYPSLSATLGITGLARTHDFFLWNAGINSLASFSMDIRNISSHRRTGMFATLITLWKNEDGATAIEYGLIAALIAVAAISAMQLVGTSLTSTFNNVASKL